MIDAGMAKELCYGVVPLQKKGGVWHVLLVKLQSGDHWGFPKGHSLPNEEPFETAKRELAEETALSVKKLLVDDQITERYNFTRDGVDISKSVTYFVAEVEGDIYLQFEELCGGKWVPLFEAQSHITYSESRNVCARVLAIFDRFQ